MVQCTNDRIHDQRSQKLETAKTVLLVVGDEGSTRVTSESADELCIDFLRNEISETFAFSLPLGRITTLLMCICLGLNGG